MKSKYVQIEVPFNHGWCCFSKEFIKVESVGDIKAKDIAMKLFGIDSKYLENFELKEHPSSKLVFKDVPEYSLLVNGRFMMSHHFEQLARDQINHRIEKKGSIEVDYEQVVIGIYSEIFKQCKERAAGLYEIINVSYKPESMDLRAIVECAIEERRKIEKRRFQ